MINEQELLASLKRNKAERIRLLGLQEKSQLIRLIEALGHFDHTNQDIAWLEDRLAQAQVQG